MLKLKLQYFGHLMRRTDSLERPWCWERLKAGGEGDDRAWDGWMASPTQWTWVWVNSRSWRWTGRPGVLQSMGSQRVRHDWATELNCKIVTAWVRVNHSQASGDGIRTTVGWQSWWTGEVLGGNRGIQAGIHWFLCAPVLHGIITTLESLCLPNLVRIPLLASTNPELLQERDLQKYSSSLARMTQYKLLQSSDTQLSSNFPQGLNNGVLQLICSKLDPNNIHILHLTVRSLMLLSSWNNPLLLFFQNVCLLENLGCLSCRKSPHFMKVSLKSKNRACDPAIPLLGMHLEKKHDPKGYTHPTVHCSTVYYGPDTEAT